MYPGNYQPQIRFWAQDGMGLIGWLQNLGRQNPLPGLPVGAPPRDGDGGDDDGDARGPEAAGIDRPRDSATGPQGATDDTEESLAVGGPQGATGGTEESLDARVEGPQGATGETGSIDDTHTDEIIPEEIEGTESTEDNTTQTAFNEQIQRYQAAIAHIRRLCQDLRARTATILNRSDLTGQAVHLQREIRVNWLAVHRLLSHVNQQMESDYVPIYHQVSSGEIPSNVENTLANLEGLISSNLDNAIPALIDEIRENITTYESLSN